MVIDEKGELALTKYRKNNIVKSDHNMLVLEIDLKFHNEKNHDRLEMVNLRNKVCKFDFKEKTTNTDMFSKCFLRRRTLMSNSNAGKEGFKNLYTQASRK